MRQAYLSTMLAFLLIPQALADVKMGPVISHEGACEPSGVVALPEGSFGQMFIVAEDEHNILRVYPAGHGGPPLVVPSGDLNKRLSLDANDDNDKADLEAATWLNGKAFWIGSHSRSGKKGKLREARWQFFSTAIQVDGSSIEISPGASYHELLAAFAALDPVLRKSIRLDIKEKKSLGGEQRGFNIEGMTAGADGRSILIGLRNPLSAKKKALVISLKNPEAVVDEGAKPALGDLIKLDLHGRGVRSLEYSAGAQSYFIVAGPVANDGAFELYRWSGHDKPKAVKGSAAAFAKIRDFHPEAMFVDASGKKLHLLSDDGDVRMEGDIACKELPPSKQSFRSVVITLED